MLFNSVQFIFVFLPAVLALTAVGARTGQTRVVRDMLLAASLVFYAWWDVSRLPLLLGTICVNYFLARITWSRPMLRTPCLVVGVLVNVGLLAYFKYRGFLLGDVLGLPGISSASLMHELPLGISFFTFQQLAWLFDAARPNAERTPLPIYALFVTFFPQLIAGPIVHHNELVPQLKGAALGRPQSDQFAAGFSLFAIGLFKKVVIADYFAPYADAAFQATAQNHLLECWQAWTGLASYACQIYFDFSGYSDMALGLGLLFGVVLPANFASPYKAHDIAEFWRRWHITLSRFLRDFIYIPLGGNRVGHVRQAVNLLITMIIGGLWHGAGYTFLLWGCLHGVLLCIVHLHRTLLGAGVRGWPRLGQAGWAITMMAILLTWVPFRAPSIAATTCMYQSLCPPTAEWLHSFVADPSLPRLAPLHLFALGNTAMVTTMLGLLVCFVMPATVDIFQEYLGDTGLPDRSAKTLVRVLAWRPTFFWAVASAGLFLLAVLDLLSAAPSAFLYFQF